MQDRELRQRIQELVGARLLVEDSPEQFAFQHELTREAAYATLLVRERKGYHRAIGEAMERLYDASLDAHLADLAYHFHRAGEWAKALEYSRRAGDRAQALYAPREAIMQYTRALEAAKQAGQLDVELLHARGHAYEIVGEFERAQADYQAALDEARARSDRQVEWESLMDLGFLWASRDYSQTGDYYRRALDLARAMGDPVTLAHSLNRLGNWHTNLDQPLEALRFHQPALDIFEELVDSRGLAETLDLLGMASLLGGDTVQATAHLERAIGLFRELDDRRGLSSSLASLAELGISYGTEARIVRGTWTQSEREAETALQIARDIGWRSGEAYALLMLGWGCGTRGDYRRALESAQRGLAIADEIEHRQWSTGGHVALGELYLDLFALAHARQRLEHALAQAKDIGSLIWERFAAGFLAMTHVAQNEFGRAEAILNAALAPDVALETVALRVCWGARLELALARGDPRLALQIADQFIAAAAKFGEQPERIIPRLWMWRGEALAGLRRMSEAEEALRAAQAEARAQGLRPLSWRIHLALGRVYLDQRRGEDAEREFSQARTIIGELAANVSDASLRENFLHSATALFPAAAG